MVRIIYFFVGILFGWIANKAWGQQARQLDEAQKPSDKLNAYMGIILVAMLALVGAMFIIYSLTGKWLFHD